MIAIDPEQREEVNWKTNLIAEKPHLNWQAWMYE